MLASCSICGDCFTGIHPESVHTTPCGHVFHYECLMTWIQRSQTCPHCRSKVTEKQIIKLYFHNNSNLSIKEDISSLTHQVQSLTYENTLKNEEIKKLLSITKKEKEQLVSLKKHVKDVEDKIRGHQTVVSSLQETIRVLKSECTKYTCYKLEAEELKKDLLKYQSINSILYGTAADSQEAVSLLKKKTDIQTLCLLITSFKKEIQTLKDSNRDLETKFSQRVSKYMELKRHLCNVNSKESVNTRVMEKLKSEITDLEAEIVRLQKKCENLESLIQANDNTPRRTELRKRIIYESPAPDLSITPSLEKSLKTVIYSPENSVSSMVQPKGQLKPHSLNNKTEQSSSQSVVNTFMPKSPRRPIGFMRPPLTIKSVSANYVSKSMVFSSSSDEEMYDGLGGRSKPDVYPSRQKPVTKKRKLVSNFKKKPPPSNDDDHVDLSLSKQKQKSIQTANMNNSTHPRMIRHEDDLERMVSEHKACSSMPYPSISCHMNTTCVYGNQTIAICKANVDCLGENTFAKNLTCRFCYQTEFWEYKCEKKICNSAASPPTYYRTNCTVNRDVLCLGRRTFLKRMRCNWTGGHRWSTALILSITLGGFGIDRFYLGHWQEGIGKLFSFGGLGVWTLIDVLLISIRYLGPADGSLYL